MPLEFTPDRLAGMIDHAMLSPAATFADLDYACRMVIRLSVGCICVRPCDLHRAKRLLENSGVSLAAVIAFPHGSSQSAIKAFEAAQAVASGADELDMVCNIGLLRAGMVDLVADDIAAVVSAAKGRCVKVILECGFLTREQMSAGCQAAMLAGAAFVKTSTGFGPTGANVEDVQFLRRQVGSKMGVKASGGITSASQALALIQAGADRIGTSRTEQILWPLMGENKKE